MSGPRDLTTAASASAPARRPSGRSLGRLVLVGVVVASVGLAAWWWRHPADPFLSGYGLEAERPVGRTLWTTLESGSTADPGVITIRALEPVVERDGAEVEVEYVLCDLDAEALQADGVSGFGYGLDEKQVDRLCARVRPAVGASMRLGTQPGQALLVGLTATRPGRTVVHGHRVEYSDGWQRGSADIEVETDLTARR